ncbi:hypothetical protein BG842_16050 [Haladaptatus sp. W1]|uniref:hypothetical protein n=1 Tax=Haladaptatus sp. W1 TaxID=1897478 RepID=UPI00084978AD|nr:hypothetical protein [Haladaptatus sp. W1]ODR81753.1 hypothetical protein BG842_16050 [Haladaptatus sp. W1]
MDVPKERIAFAIAAIGFSYLGISNAIRADAVLSTNTSLFFFAALGFLFALAVDMFYEGNAAE